MQLSLREWDIPFYELELGEAIGQGRFGTVHRGNWHGDVAIRLLNMDQVDTGVDEKVLESFKLEVSLNQFCILNELSFQIIFVCSISRLQPFVKLGTKI